MRLRDLMEQLTYRAPYQNPTLDRRGLLGADFAGWHVDEFGPPPAVHYARELAFLSDAAVIAGPQRRTPATATARGRAYLRASEASGGVARPLVSRTGSAGQ